MYHREAGTPLTLPCSSRISLSPSSSHRAASSGAHVGQPSVSASYEHMQVVWGQCHRAVQNKRLHILELSTEKLKSNGSPDVAHPASLEFDPFHCHRPGWPLLPRGRWGQTADRQGQGGATWTLRMNFVLKRGRGGQGAFRSYLCNAASTSLIISLISLTRPPYGLERSSGSCLNWLRRWTCCCNYRGD